MATWKYSVESGNVLREAVHEWDLDNILGLLRGIYREIHEELPNVLDEYDLEDVLSEIDITEGTVYSHYEGEVDEEDVEDEINGLLRDLYDFCDINRIWIEM